MIIFDVLDEELENIEKMLLKHDEQYNVNKIYD